MNTKQILLTQTNDLFVFYSHCTLTHPNHYLRNTSTKDRARINFLFLHQI